MDARAWFAGRGSDAGLAVSIDGVQNVIVGGDHVDQAAVLTGSHLDSVPGGGMFDGAVGAIAALECVRRIHEEKLSLHRPIRAIAFSDEEGAFFGFLGSKVMTTGVSEAEIREAAGRDGRDLVEALARCGTDPAGAANPTLVRSQMHAFVELHVEQGPVLETYGTAIGVVTEIVGVNRADVSFQGRPDHAGTTPMNRRRDPVRGAAAFLERLSELPARLGNPDAVVTCGRVTVDPGADNVVPAAAVVHLDYRDTTPEGIAQMEDGLMREANACAARHGLGVEYRRTSVTAPARLDSNLAEVIESAARSLNLSTRCIPSRAGHDAQVMATHVPTGMIFVPSHDGRSHSRWERSSWDDIENGANVLLQTLISVASDGERVT
jgi:N-carbamoyl-L-amino-acid hydrolase